ncbi:glycosyl hydrolase [Thalassobacillus devorans]|uniref:Glycosyl hydrolase n=1 Tax=Thalassobacillus devorans TaxID=279813 RepID=A0ABQ1NUL5_9BACI|nr:glycoside hydrolase family 1 protein [Thalassobacillus devorans]NIK28576.1 6-phospho-beta-glucosidase [Thalassobacillus devorans]GGC85140.1 glycosyl hydrolase [Thalassobacillus devorans]
MGITFPEGFLWGTATSAPQFEGASTTGGKAEHVWDYWYKKTPELFHNQVGPEHTSDFYHNVDRDMEGMKQLKLNSFRTSISWSRLMPDGSQVNEEAVRFYRYLFKSLHNNGIKPIVNLYHFDMPLSFHKKGGWESRETVFAYSHYACTAFSLFGDLVEDWVTFNEPIVPIEMGYLNDKHLPAIYDMKKAVKAAYHTMLAHAMAVKEFRRQSGVKIGIILNLSPVYPKSDSSADRMAADYADLFFNRSFLDPAVKGTYPDELINWTKELGIVPPVAKEDLAIIKENTVDFLGVNYYQPRRVQQPVKRENGLSLDAYYSSYEWPERRINPYRGWEIYEKGLYDIAVRIKEEYGNLPWFVAENGIGVEGEERFADHNGDIQDDYRIEFISEHLKWLYKGITEGSNCYGYHVWTFVDNWSWLNAYKNRYGLFRLDLNTKERQIKKSGKWFRVLASENELPEKTKLT